MYSSLQKVDVAVKDKETGKPLLVQTDHRTPEEIEAEIELSILFALTRTIAPKRAEQFKDGTVRYTAIAGAHPSIAIVCASTGAEIEAEMKPFDLSGVERRKTEDLAEEAFTGLAAKVMAREKIAADEAGLVELTNRFLASRPNMEEDEIGYWTAIAELAAVTGEVIRKAHGGRWVDDPKDYADIPFVFQAGDGFVNPVGKSIKCFMHGETEAPIHLLRSLDDMALPDGPMLFTFKPAGWGMENAVYCEPLLESKGMGEPIPLVVFGRDRPNTFAQIMKQSEKKEDIADLRAQARKNITAVDVQIEKLGVLDLDIWMVHGSYFAAEKVLDQAFMRGMHERIGSEMLAAAMPEKGRLFVMSALQAPEKIIKLMALASGVFEQNEGGRQICPTVFIVQDGEVVGVASPKTEEPPKKKGFFARLFN